MQKAVPEGKVESDYHPSGGQVRWVYIQIWGYRVECFSNAPSIPYPSTDATQIGKTRV